MWRWVAVAALGVLACAVALRGWAPLLVVQVRGPSMEPVLPAGQRVLCRRNRRGFTPTAGRLVVAVAPRLLGDRWCWPTSRRRPTRTKLMIKRVAAGAGVPVPATVSGAAGLPAGAPVPPGFVVLLGDNAACSTDSREFGLVPVGHVVGPVVGRFRRAAAVAAEPVRRYRLPEAELAALHARIASDEQAAAGPPLPGAPAPP